MAIADEIRAAVGAVTGVRAVGRDLPRESEVAGLVFYPLIGAAIGVLAGVAARLAAPLGAPAAAVAAVAVLAALSGGRTVQGLAATASGVLVPGGHDTVLAHLRGRPSALGVVAAAAVCLAKLWAVGAIPGAARTVALALAAMLGRWAVVVQCYGGSPVAARGPAAQLVGRARLREFGWASAVAFAVTLAALDAVGLLVLLAATVTTVGVRVLAYRRAGGVGGEVLDASAELVETAALIVLAALARG